MGWIGCEYLDMDWEWEQNLHMVGSEFKMSRSELNMSESVWEKAKNEW